MQFPFFWKKSTGQVTPWHGRVPIFQYLKANPESTKSDLPDEVKAPDKISWASGAKDGVMGHHGSNSETQQTVNRLTSLLLKWQQKQDDLRLRPIYELASDDVVLSLADPLGEQLPKVDGLSADLIHDVATWLCASAPDRGPVKLGIILLGLTGNEGDKDILHALGRHEEFTLFSAVALGRISTDWVLELWELGKHVDGWGKIHVVERLCRQDDPRLKDWFIRDGFRNSIMNEYLAVPCAKAGKLHEALQQAIIDEGLLSSTSEIIDALINGGPAEDIDSYPDAPAALTGYLAHVATRQRPDLGHYLTTDRITKWLQADGSAWAERYSRGWSPETAQRCRELCATIRDKPHWLESALQQVDTEEHHQHWVAAQTLETLGHPMWDIYWKHLRRKPAEAGRWYHLMNACDATRIDTVVAFAESVLPLAEMVKQEAPKSLFPIGWQACLDFILQDLRRFPGKGWSLVEVGLRAPNVRCRNMAMMALSTWGEESWPQEAQKALRAAMGREPDERVRLNFGRVLNGDPPS